MMTTQDLVDALEGRREGREFRCRCPVHGGRSLSITEKEGRILLVCRAGCSQADVISEIKRLGLWNNTSYVPHPPAPEPPDDTPRRANRASETWEQAHPITSGDPVHRYLAGRGIVLKFWPEDLRTHPNMDYWEINNNGKPIRTGTLPAMIAVVRSPTGKPVALHRTYLTMEGQKAPVKSPKKIMKVHDLTGSAIRLFSPRDGFLAVAEGIEDALSAWILWKIPCWAAIGTSGMKSFTPPGEVKEVLVLSDNDEPGKKAALELDFRLKETKKAVRVMTPSGQKDINQLLMKGLHHG